MSGFRGGRGSVKEKKNRGISLRCDEKNKMERKGEVPKAR